MCELFWERKSVAKCVRCSINITEGNTLNRFSQYFKYENATFSSNLPDRGICLTQQHLHNINNSWFLPLWWINKGFSYLNKNRQEKTTSSAVSAFVLFEWTYMPPLKLTNYTRCDRADESADMSIFSCCLWQRQSLWITIRMDEYAAILS